LPNSVLCLNVCYSEYSVPTCNTGTCVLRETCKYLLIWNVSAALCTTVADCNASDRDSTEKTLLCKRFVHRSKIQSSALFVQKTQPTICIATHRLHHNHLKIIRNVITDESEVSECVLPIKVKRPKFFIFACIQGTQAKPSNCPSCISIKKSEVLFAECIKMSFAPGTLCIAT